ncbi:UbiX family flavin prenyltransferase [Burkholderia sp. Bp8986]|uniref:UbiX family flavin prenyltransferase n=1 Tax=Burkholderia sp. Bp8986 TaxID=2184550 RepID=UPI000F596052|nr:UbiX family flavin prenyltransferase [Burkholderia sp. Bp8986]RQS41943.1 UbiX family flavin prenyltransferase [Burkholderia sp. Bp8986]
MTRIVVCITGATGAIYGIRLLEVLAEIGVERHLVLSKWARVTLHEETPYDLDYVHKLASRVYTDADQAASLSSGSFRHDGMIIAPCSMKTLAGIRVGYADNLIVRAADVALKEQRRLVLMVRETPLSTIHLENMLFVARAGATIFPAMPAFYNHPQSIDDIINQSVGRALDLFGLDTPRIKRWDGLSHPRVGGGSNC